MTKESDEYERFIASLIENVRNMGRDIGVIGFGRKNELIGKSEQPHQIDVSFVDRSFPKPTQILIECKHWKSNVDVSAVKVVSYTLNDILENPAYLDRGMGIIVATSGFQKGATRVAGYENIIVQTVNDAPPYGFRYEDIVQEAVESVLNMRDDTEIEVKRKGKLIDEQGDVIWA